MASNDGQIIIGLGVLEVIDAAIKPARGIMQYTKGPAAGADRRGTITLYRRGTVRNAPTTRACHAHISTQRKKQQ
jgi:hypothetical protein